MNLKNCSECNIKPKRQSTLGGMMCRFICPSCGKHTQDIMSPSSTLANPQADEETIKRLTEEWNNKN